MSRRRARAVAAAVLAGIVALGLALGVRSPRTGAVETHAAGLADAPNFLIILADDQANNTFRPAYMPRTFERLVAHGTRFANGLAAPPLCCPDRAGILTGQYPHNHGVFGNTPGYPSLRDPQDTLPVWLHRDGYRTGFVGKYLNNYESVAGAQPAPGFDRWFALQEYAGYYYYDVSNNGVVRHYGRRREDYSTDVLTLQARRFLDQSADKVAPFFLWLAYEAPHGSGSTLPACAQAAAPAPPDQAAYDAFKGVPLPHPPAFNERDVSDKPRAIRRLRLLDRRARGVIARNWRCTLAAVNEMDKGVGQVMQELRDQGERDRTIVVYVSDNGLFFGEHRLPSGKSDVYEPALDVPFVVSVPPRYRDGGLDRLTKTVVSNQDIAPTFLDYASRSLGPVDACASPTDCRRMDGHSLAPLLASGGTWPSDRGVLAEIDVGDRHHYHAVRTRRYVYSQLASGERELYDLRTDPDELRNHADEPAYQAVQKRLAARLARLRTCSGVESRDAPSAKPFCE